MRCGVVGALVAGLVGAAEAAQARDGQLKALGVRQLQARPSSPFVHDGIVREARPPALRTRLPGWGGPIAASTGELVTVYVSDSYSTSPTLQQSAADFIAQLYHGSELATAVFYLAPLAEVERFCGAGSWGCYMPDTRTLVAPGQDLPDGTSVETILAHEYGHHVAASRDNAPWSALDWGTKRWASYMNVCSRERRGMAFPGDQGEAYLLNPGEAFAETYRLLNYQHYAGGDWPQAVWNVDDSFYPDEGALEAAKQDVLDPWHAPSVTTWAGRIGTFAPKRPSARTSRGRRRLTGVLSAAREIRIPRDGTLTVTIDRAPGAASLSLRDLRGKLLASSAAGRLSYTVCGQRTLVVGVNAQLAGAFSTSVSTP